MTAWGSFPPGGIQGPATPLRAACDDEDGCMDDTTTPSPADSALATPMAPDRQQALARFLAGCGLADTASSLRTPGAALRSTRLTAGYSNVTWRVDGGRVPLVVRQAPPGVQLKGAYDMAREYGVMRALAAQWRRVPQPLALCEDESVLGSRFFILPFVQGRTVGVGASLDAAALRRASNAFIDTLAELHRLDPSAAGLPPRAAEPGFARRQVAGAIQRFGAAQMRTVPLLDEVFAALLREAVDTGTLAVTHNDYRLDNVIVDAVHEDRVLAVIDWEMAAIGDPWLDLGSALAYWTEAGDDAVLVEHALGPTHLPGAPSRADVAERYALARGSESRSLPWYVAVGLVRLVVVLQQLQARSLRAGGPAASDPRLARIEPWIDALVRRAAITLERNRA
jgi:aminoglycoside phosphotransferase (APT) family kinase protein